MRDVPWPCLFGWLNLHPNWRLVRSDGHRRLYLFGETRVVHKMLVSGPGPVPRADLEVIARLSGLTLRQLVNEARAINAAGGTSSSQS